MTKKHVSLAVAEPHIEGVRALEPCDEAEVLERAIKEWRKTERLEKRRAAQVIRFDSGQHCLVNAADQHIGDSGTDYERMFHEAEIIRSTPGMWAILVGDLWNNFIMGRLRQARDNARLALTDELILGKKYLGILAPKLLLVASGNHDQWITLLTGIDYFREVLAQIRPDCIYDSDDVRITLKIGKREWPGRIRHQWRGQSIYNITHGLERGARFDGDFVWGVGAHTHTAGAVRDFVSANGGDGKAVLCGSYKRTDPYARRLGFAKPNASTAVSLIFDDVTGAITGVNSLEYASYLMRLIYRKS